MKTVPFCETPVQSLVVGVAAGVGAGLLGVSEGLGVTAVAIGAGIVALAADVGVHILRRDPQFSAATQRLSN